MSQRLLARSSIPMTGPKIYPILYVVSWNLITGFAMGLIPDTRDCGLRMHQECRKRFPRHRLQRKTLVSDPSMHHGTCVPHVSWCMSGSLTRCGEENVPGIPGACATCNFAHLASGKTPIVVVSLLLYWHTRLFSLKMTTKKTLWIGVSFSIMWLQIWICGKIILAVVGWCTLTVWRFRMLSANVDAAFLWKRFTYWPKVLLQRQMPEVAIKNTFHKCFSANNPNFTKGHIALT